MKIFSALLLGLALSVLATPTSGVQAVETPSQKDARMKWWRDAKFGMFIHWGLYAVPAGYWNGKAYGGAAEWLLNSAQIKVEDYEKLKPLFNPVKFNAKEWVRIAKDAGMKYIVITSKHHEGFAMFDTKQSDWGIMHTPYKRDPMKDLAKACKEQGIRLCFYHSIMDWHHPDYLPRRAWDPRPDVKAEFPRYVKYMKEQLKEILTNYGPIGILWFDGEWEATWTHDQGVDLYNYVRSLQPNIIINNRVDTGRGGMNGMSNGVGPVGDYGTPEQEIPASGIPGKDWESCMTMNDTWGFSRSDQNWKSATTLVRNLVDCVSKGGNYLLNVGPTAEGVIPEPSVERLSKVGSWLRRNGEAIYGAHPSPFPKPLPWGFATQKPGKLYLHVFNLKGDKLELPGLKADVVKVYRLGDKSKKALAAKEDERGWTIGFPQSGRDDVATVLVAEVKGSVKAEALPVGQSADGTVTLAAIDAIAHGSLRYESDKNAIGFWTSAQDWLDWEFDVKKPGRFEVTLSMACQPGEEGSEFQVQLGSDAAGGAQTLRSVVPNTGSWSTFVQADLGEFNIAQPGRHVVLVRPLRMAKGAVMNLRRITLKLSG